MATSEHQEQEEAHEDDFEDDVEQHHSEPFDDDDDPQDDEAESPCASHEHKPEPEPEYHYEEVGVDPDHRMAQLGKLRNSVVGDNDLSLPAGMLTADDTGPTMLVCPNCSSEQVRGHRFCTECNARLPNLIVAEQKFNPGSVDGEARKYYDAVTKFQSVQMSLDDFIDFLNKGLERVRAHAENLAELSADNVISEWIPEAAALISSATLLWYDSVEGMLFRIEDCQVEFDEEEAMLEELDEEELAERDPPVPLEERVRMIDFTPELEAIFRANDQMLEYLRIVDTELKSEAQTGGMHF